MAEKRAKKPKDLDPKRKGSDVKGGKLVPESGRKLVRRLSDKYKVGDTLRDSKR